MKLFSFDIFRSIKLKFTCYITKIVNKTSNYINHSCSINYLGKQNYKYINYTDVSIRTHVLINAKTYK